MTNCWNMHCIVFGLWVLTIEFHYRIDNVVEKISFENPYTKYLNAENAIFTLCQTREEKIDKFPKYFWNTEHNMWHSLNIICTKSVKRMNMFVADATEEGRVKKSSKTIHVLQGGHQWYITWEVKLIEGILTRII